MKSTFALLMISAMYENGGNTAHRLMDGHPDLSVYPFESQLGTRLVSDYLASMIPQKYRWPVFSLSGSPDEWYDSIIDEECRVRIRTPHVSKFRDCAIELDDGERRALFKQYLATALPSGGKIVAAFFRATFDAWKNCRQSGREKIYVGYSPCIAVDAEKIFHDIPDSHLLHIVRNPFSAYADTKKRPVPLPLSQYASVWAFMQYTALCLKEILPDRFHIIRYEDMIRDPLEAFRPLCEKINIDVHENLKAASWNGEHLPEVYPWGTIRTPTEEANRMAADRLSKEEKRELSMRTLPFLKILNYEH